MPQIVVVIQHFPLEASYVLGREDVYPIHFQLGCHVNVVMVTVGIIVKNMTVVLPTHVNVVTVQMLRLVLVKIFNVPAQRDIQDKHVTVILMTVFHSLAKMVHYARMD